MVTAQLDSERDMAERPYPWVPASAGMTERGQGPDPTTPVIPAQAGIRNLRHPDRNHHAGTDGFSPARE